MTNRELIHRLLNFPMDVDVQLLVPGEYLRPDQKVSIADLYEDVAGRIILEP